MAENPVFANNLNAALTGPQDVTSDLIDRRKDDAFVPQTFDMSAPVLPTVATADLAKAMDRFVTEFAQPYDTNKDGIFAGKELHDLAGAVIDKAGQMAPALVANRETILAAVDRVGSVSTEQLKSLIQQAAAMADANGDGKVDPQEYQNLLRVTTDKTLQR